MRKIITDKLFLFDNVLDLKECNTLIDYYNYKGPTHKWGNFYPLRICFYNTPQDIINCFLKIENKIADAVSKHVTIDWCEIVKWPKESYMQIHKDTASDQTVLTSITYLNSTYSGGQTYIENSSIQAAPKAGRTLCFDGNLHAHSVTKITNGERYTLPIWYKT